MSLYFVDWFFNNISFQYQKFISPEPYILTNVSSSPSVNDILVICGVLEFLLGGFKVVLVGVLEDVRVGDQDVREGSGLGLSGRSWIYNAMNDSSFVMFRIKIWSKFGQYGIHIHIYIIYTP